jgi:AcrR family transcriptional regulator
MARPKVNIVDRREKLIAAATLVFADKGFRQAQMSDIAEKMAVSSGSLYNYVDSKETLFCWVLAAAFEVTVDYGVPLEPVAFVLATNADLATLSWTPRLDAALEENRPVDFEAEIEDVVGELYDFNRRFGIGIRIIETSAIDYPELKAVYFNHLRKNFIGKLETYISRRHGQGLIAPSNDLEITTRSLIEIIAWWGIRQPHDPTSTHYSTDRMREQVVRFAVRGLTAKG